MKNNVRTTVVLMIAFILFCIAIWFAGTSFYLWLYGVIAVKIFGLPALSFWQFVGLEMLCSALFKNTVSSKATEEKSKEIYKAIIEENK